MNEPAKKETGKAALICLLLALAVWGVFGRSLQTEFVHFDDNMFVTENPYVLQGFTKESVRWAFATGLTEPVSGGADFWRPLSYLSHILDVELYGVDPRGHHLTSVLLHMANAVLLFLILRAMTGAVWRSALVAALFAVHPLRVESVSWIAERKDVLSCLFFLLTMGTYLRYVRVSRLRQGSGGQAGGGWRVAGAWYLAVVLLFACGLMSKPMVVTLPFVLLLLDFWPLRRIAKESRVEGQKSNVERNDPECSNGRCLTFDFQTFDFRLLLEKLPLLAMSAATALITTHAVGAGVERKLSFSWRLANAAVAYAGYLQDMIFPADLAVFYPHPATSLPLWKAAASLVLLLCISAAALWQWRKRPYLLTGWLWYAGTLVPVAGLMQAGGQATADRYTYIPMIGVLLAVVWGASGLKGRWRTVVAVVSVSAVALYAAVAWRQVAVWKNTRTLFEHALQAGYPCSANYNGLAAALVKQGDFDGAAGYFLDAVRFDPRFAPAYENLANALLHLNRHDEAIENFEKAIRLNPAWVQELKKSLQPVVQKRDWQRAAVRQSRAHLARSPDDKLFLNNLAWVLATSPYASIRSGTEAVTRAEKVCNLTGGNHPGGLDTLAAAYAEAGRFDEAVTTAERAVERAQGSEHEKLIPGIKKRLELYRQRTPYRE